LFGFLYWGLHAGNGLFQRLLTINLSEIPYEQRRGCRLYATVFLFMSTRPQKPDPDSDREPGSLYCPNCAEEVTDPLTCGDCSSVICRRCGTALESSDELGIG
jgi:hypothetical protein